MDMHTGYEKTSPAPRGTRPNLLDLGTDGLAALMTRLGEPNYRIRQIEHWVYRKFTDRFANMSNLPPGLRRILDSHYTVLPLALDTLQVSRTGDALKVLFRLEDGAQIEAVLMLYDRRQTLCISSQVGCAMGCRFCATGLDGLARNLTPGEIMGQVLYLSMMLARPEVWDLDLKASGTRVSNIVYMGMGEPFHNYDAVWHSIRTLVSGRYYGLGARNITVSTVGLAPQILAMAQEKLPVRLAVSLHAPNDTLRAQIVPPARRWSIQDILAAVCTYIGRTNRRVTFEYVMLEGWNDDPALGTELGRLLHGLLCHVNLIPFNPIPGDQFRAAPAARIQAFAAHVQAEGIPVSIRVRRGIEMDAGCGQLRKRESAALSLDLP